MSARPWGEAHRREALIRIFEIGAELARAHGKAAAHRTLSPWFGHMGPAADPTYTEAQFRELLSGPLVEFARTTLTPARIDAEVRRVRALAEGRLVRETVWRRDEDPGFGDLFSTKDLAGGGVGLRSVRVTRIRRAAR
jgi:hypothetical protein